MKVIKDLKKGDLVRVLFYQNSSIEYVKVKEVDVENSFVFVDSRIGLEKFLLPNKEALDKSNSKFGLLRNEETGELTVVE